MAVRFRKGRASPWQCYWNNPVTGKRESESFATELEAEKHDSLIKHRIRSDRESFLQEIEIQGEGSDDILTLEMCYLESLKQKQFSRKGLSWQMDAMRYPLSKIGAKAITDISSQDLAQIKTEMLAMPVKSASVRCRLSVLRTVLYWCASQGYIERQNFPTLPPAHQNICAAAPAFRYGEEAHLSILIYSR